jgi:putative hydrolase
MADDLFSQFFELFNQPGSVNLKLAAEVAHHLAGERQPVDPWAAEEFRELTRLAEFELEQVAPFPVRPAPDVVPGDGRDFVDRSLEGSRYLAEPFADMIDLGAAGPAAEMLKPVGSAMAGMQIGTLLGSLAGWALASFDAGVPLDGGTPIAFIVPNIDRFVASHDLDAREVRLSAALNEVAHRAMFDVPFTRDHLVALLQDYADTIRTAPTDLMQLMQGMDPSDLQSGAIDPDALASLFDKPETRAAAGELRSFLGLTIGYRRLLVARAAGTMLPSLDRMYAHRDVDRNLGDEMAGSAFAATFVPAEVIDAGRTFCLEIERRYGSDELDAVFTREGRFATAAEIADPVAWAARVLLPEMDA